jgi:16S rRNA (guanine527-N7)-methyltransferase
LRPDVSPPTMAPSQASSALPNWAPSAAQSERLDAYLALLERWNRHINLTAVREPQAMRVQHLADCLAIVPALERQLGQPLTRAQGRWLDAGSGGGLPGVVLAVLAPRLDVHCVDAVAKKTAFIREAAAQLRLPNLHGDHSRVEALPRARFDVAISRAFASLADFCAWTDQTVKPGGLWVAMKGRVPDEEIAALPPSHRVFHVEPVAVSGLEAQRCLVWIERVPCE